MKNKAVRPHLPVLVSAAAFFLLALSGCGGAHESVEPILSGPNPITTRASYADPAAPTIAVSFPVIAWDASIQRVEYHIYRNDVLVARLPPPTVTTTEQGDKAYITYTDTGQTQPTDYKTVGQPPVQLMDARSPGVGAFSSSTPIIYRIAEVLGSPGVDGQITYNEGELGRSDVITPLTPQLPR